jgi:hypothetical protein
MANDGGDLNVMFDPTPRDFYCEQAPDTFSPVPGGWGKQGATRCDLKRVDKDTLLSALKAAHALASAPKPKSVAKKPARKPKRSSKCVRRMRRGANAAIIASRVTQFARGGRVSITKPWMRVRAGTRAHPES